ncbi:MerR family transcriptional regulator, partial [Streptomyces chiangmaiensis]
MTTYRISQLAEHSGVPASTLRFYETAGLLPAERTASGYRVYGEDARRGWVRGLLCGADPRRARQRRCRIRDWCPVGTRPSTTGLDLSVCLRVGGGWRQ